MILNKEGHPTRSQSLGQKNQSDGWSRQLVLSLIRDRAYKGEALLTTKVDPNTRKEVKLETPVVIHGVMPAIVDPEVWERANKNLDQSCARIKANNQKSFVMLRGLVYCLCGRKCDLNYTKTTMKTTGETKMHYYYVCNTRTSREGKCSYYKTRSARQVHQEALADVINFLNNPTQIQRELEKKESRESKLQALRDNRADLEARIAKIDKSRERIVVHIKYYI